MSDLRSACEQVIMFCLLDDAPREPLTFEWQERFDENGKLTLRVIGRAGLPRTIRAGDAAVTRLPFTLHDHQIALAPAPGLSAAQMSEAVSVAMLRALVAKSRTREITVANSLVELALENGELARIDHDKFQVPPGHPAFGPPSPS